MHINGIDDTDNLILNLLKENARYTHSELATKVGLSRIAIKNRIKAMEEMGLIKGYEVKIAPMKVKNSIEFFITVSPRPEHYDYVVTVLAKNDLIMTVKGSTGDCKIFAYGVAPDTEKMDALYRKLRGIFTDVRYFSFDTIVSTYKDVDGGIEFEKPREQCTTDA